MSISHASIDKWVARLTSSLRGDFALSLTRMDKYEGMITAKLAAKQMPHELIYLAMIESNFNPNARSKVGAVGMWQFMSATARQFGLTVKGNTDERKNPADATDAALTYLSQLHDRFGSWYLAAAAYNSGAGTVSKALKKVTGKTQGTDEDFFRILPALPKETQDYVPKLIAAAKVGSNPDDYGM
ncbi:MAG: lytic transglycosylase domain-containing protein [bacterium]